MFEGADDHKEEEEDMPDDLLPGELTCGVA